METRVHRFFSEADIALIADTAHRWRQDGEATGDYADVPGFCRSVKLEEIQAHGYVLTPGRYVGAEAVEDDGEAFAERMERLRDTLLPRLIPGKLRVREAEAMLTGGCREV